MRTLGLTPSPPGYTVTFKKCVYTSQDIIQTKISLAETCLENTYLKHFKIGFQIPSN